MSDGDPSKNEADQRTIVALLLLLAVAGLLLGLVAIVLPQVLGIVLVVGGLGLFAVSHYVVWGWWLPRYLKRLSDQESDPDHRSWMDNKWILWIGAGVVFVLLVIAYIYKKPRDRKVIDEPRKISFRIHTSKAT